MKSEQEIKDKLLSIYQSREEFSRIVNELPNTDKETMQSVIDVYHAITSEKIYLLRWVLNE